MQSHRTFFLSSWRSHAILYGRAFETEEMNAFLTYLFTNLRPYYVRTVHCAHWGNVLLRILHLQKKKKKWEIISFGTAVATLDTAFSRWDFVLTKYNNIYWKFRSNAMRLFQANRRKNALFSHEKASAVKTAAIKLRHLIFSMTSRYVYHQIRIL